MKVRLNDNVHPGMFGLNFIGKNPDLYNHIATYIRSNIMYINLPNSKLIKDAHPFIQSHSSDYLLIEFWTSDIDKILAFCDFFAREFFFTYEEKDNNAD
jgi:hypothetical protein